MILFADRDRDKDRERESERERKTFLVEVGLGEYFFVNELRRL